MRRMSLSCSSNCLDDPESCSHFIQSGTTAYIAHGKKGGSEGKYPVRPSNVSTEDRRKKLVELKERPIAKTVVAKGIGKVTKNVS